MRDRPHELTIVSADEWVLLHADCDVENCEVADAIHDTQLTHRLKRGVYIITGVDGYGEPVLGPRQVTVGDAGAGMDKG